MAKIYEYSQMIDELISSAVNPETGEIDLESIKGQLDELSMEREAKIESLILYYKDETAMAKSIKEEMEVLKARADSHSKKAESLKQYIEYVLAGENFETAKVKVTYRKSEEVAVPKDFDWSKLSRRDYITKSVTYKPDKAKLKALIKSGKKFAFAELVNKRNIQIK